MLNPAIRRSLPAAGVCACLFLGGCFLGKKPEAKLTSEPSIERALELLNTTPAGKPVTEFLRRNPVRLEYANTAGLCHKFSLKTGGIYLPRELKEPDAVRALTLARAAYIYRLMLLSGLDDLISEQEELGALYLSRVGLELNLPVSDLKKNRAASELQSVFCTYLMDGSMAAAARTRDAALSPQPDCQRPLETLQFRRVWLGKILESINDDTFFQLLHERDQARVRKGIITMNAAMQNEAILRALPSYEVYRYQRSFYDRQNETLERMERLYREALDEDKAWRKANQASIAAAREEFSACNLPE